MGPACDALCAVRPSRALIGDIQHDHQHNRANEKFPKHNPILNLMAIIQKHEHPPGLRDKLLDMGYGDKGIPLSRNAYLIGTWGAEMPDPWTYEHEAEVPECFRDPSAVTPRAQPPT